VEDLPSLQKPDFKLRQMIQAVKLDIQRYAHEKNNLWLVLITNLYTHPAIASVIYYRIGNYLWISRQNPFLKFLMVFYRLIYPVIRQYGGVELSPRACIGPGLCILHFGPTVIHPDVTAGEDLTIMNGVTIGIARGGVPRIGNRVSIGCGAKIIGGIKIGDDVYIGAGAVVIKDLPDNCTAVGIPARAILNQSTGNNGDGQEDTSKSV
jgi:serine O-acetyltransferase